MLTDDHPCTATAEGDRDVTDGREGDRDSRDGREGDGEVTNSRERPRQYKGGSILNYNTFLETSDQHKYTRVRLRIPFVP